MIAVLPKAKENTLASLAVQRQHVLDEARRRHRTWDKRLTDCVTCELVDGVLTLQGTVPTYYIKQVALELLRGIEGVEHFANRVAVFRCVEQQATEVDS